MTPDRRDDLDPGDDVTHAVLDEGVSIDTTRIGILGGHTAQLEVTLPPVDDDDLDEDVVDDVDPVVHPAEIAAAVDETAEGDHAEPAAEVTTDTEAVRVRLRASLRTGELPVADAEAEPATGETPNAGDVDASDLDAHTSEAAVTDADATDADVVTVEPSDLDTADADANASTSTAPASAAAVPDLERIRTPRVPEVTLQSRRLGELGDGGEASDLLTADRLLDPGKLVRPAPEGTWPSLVYRLTGGRVNLGDGRAARERKELDRRIGAPVSGGARFVPVLSRKGGVGKTTVTTLLGMALADARDDRVIAIDANPDRGTLAERVGGSDARTVRDLVRARDEVIGFNDLSAIVARDQTRLDVLASDTDPHVSEAFSDGDYRDVATVAAHYYSLVLTDTGTGIVHSVMGATLDRADGIVIVAGLSVDEARLASETLTWLETNGYADLVRSAVVVLNTARPGAPLVRPDELVTHFSSRVRAVVRIPHDAHIATGSRIVYAELHPATRRAARELAAMVVEGLRAAG